MFIINKKKFIYFLKYDPRIIFILAYVNCVTINKYKCVQLMRLTALTA